MDPNSNSNNDNHNNTNGRPDYSNAFNFGYQNQLKQQQEWYLEKLQQLRSLQQEQWQPQSVVGNPHNLFQYPFQPNPTYPVQFNSTYPVVSQNPVNNSNVFQHVPPPYMSQQPSTFMSDFNHIQSQWNQQPPNVAPDILSQQQQQIEFRNTEYIRNFTKQSRLANESFQENGDSSFEQSMIEEPVIQPTILTEEPQDNTTFYTLEEIQVDLNMNNSRSVELKFEYYTQLSNHFIHKAHSIVGKTTQEDVMDTYYKMIKIGINCLKVLEKYNLDLFQSFTVYYRLAEIYLQETEDLEIGENYINRAISLAQNLNDIPSLFKCELMIIQLIEKSNFRTLVNYLNSKIHFYRVRNLDLLVEVLEVIKVRYNVVNNPDTSLSSLAGLIYNSQNDQIKAFCLIQSANLHLHRSSPDVALKLIEQADGIIKYNKIESLVLPLLLAKFVAYIHLNKDCKNIILQASKFMTQDNGSTSGLKDGKISLSLFVPELNHNFEFKFDWLTVEEFSVVAHLLTGVALLSDSRNKSKICFEKALKNISKIEKTSKLSNLTIEKFHQKLQRLKYFKILTSYYQTINNFILNNYHVDPLNKFMQMTLKQISEEEYSLYKGFYPMVYYCFAMFYHHNGDIQAAKYYYIKVIEQQSGRSPYCVKDSFIQLLYGVQCESIAPKGKFNELYIFSTLNLAILLDFECTKLRDKTPSYEIELKNKCLSDLEEAFNGSSEASNTTNTFNLNFTLNNDILNVTYYMVLKALLNKETDLEIKNKMEAMLLQWDRKSSFAFFCILMMYLLEFKINGDEGEKLLDYYRDKSKQDPDTDDLVRLLILKVFIKHFKTIGDHDKAALSQMQYDQCIKKLNRKFEFLNNNLVPTRE